MRTTTNRFIVLCILSSLLAGCSTTVIRSKPEGAKVYLNEQYKGTTPYTHSDTKIVGTKTRLRLTMEGYEPLNTSFARDEQVDVGAVVAGCFFLFPFLWTEKYLPEHTYELTPLSTPAAKQ